MSIPADFNNFQKIPNSSGIFKKSKRAIYLKDLEMPVALESIKTYTNCPKPSWKEKIFGKRYVVLQVTDGTNSVYVKVNKKNLEKRLMRNDFNEELKNQKNRDMTKFTMNVISEVQEYELIKKKEERDNLINDFKMYPYKLNDFLAERQDRALIIEVIKEKPEAFKYAHNNLKSDKGFVKEAIQSNPKVLKYVSKSMREDPEIKALTP